jgi:hypothetical protein
MIFQGQALESVQLQARQKARMGVAPSAPTQTQSVSSIRRLLKVKVKDSVPAPPVPALPKLVTRDLSPVKKVVTKPIVLK